MRTRRLSALLAASLLALAAAGCGGSDGGAAQVPGPPAEVSIPESDQAPAEAASSEGADSADPDSTTDDDTSTSDDTGTTDDTTTPDSAGTDTGGATSPDSSTDGGATAPDTGEDSAENDTAPPAGSNAEQFEDFCAQNPGAC